MSFKYVFSTIPNVLKKHGFGFYSHALFVVETTTDMSEWKWEENMKHTVQKLMNIMLSNALWDRYANKSSLD